MSAVKRLSALGLSIAIVVAVAPRAAAYLKLGTLVGSQVVPIKWTALPIRYFVTNRDVPGVSAVQLQAAIDRAFGTWTAVPNVGLSDQFAGFTTADPFNDDGVSVIGFQARPELDRTLGATTFQLDSVTGAVLESDIFLNSSFAWSIAGGGEAGHYDAQAILTHEIGHLLGLSHSALGETQLQASGGRTVLGKAAVMFPIAYPAGNVIDRSLDPDDVAGLEDLYASSAALSQTGSIGGRVTLNGAGIFGAHVTAANTTTGALVAGFTLTPQGDFAINALAPGLYVVRVEPLDDADLGSFFDDTSSVNIGFRPTFYPRLVAVPAGGSSGSIEIRVSAK
jgi:Matrixin